MIFACLALDGCIPVGMVIENANARPPNLVFLVRLGCSGGVLCFLSFGLWDCSVLWLRFFRFVRLGSSSGLLLFFESGPVGLLRSMVTLFVAACDWVAPRSRFLALLLPNMLANCIRFSLEIISG